MPPAICGVRGQHAADRIAHLKKGDMASEAETLLAGSGWLPEPLRTPGAATADAASDVASEPAVADE